MRGTPRQIRISGDTISGDGADYQTKAIHVSRGIIAQMPPTGLCIHMRPAQLEAYDFTTTAFKMDGSYNDLDLSAIIPPGAKAACVWVAIYDTNVGRGIVFRPNGSNNNINVTTLRVLEAGYTNYADFIIALDDNRVIEYASYTGDAVTTINLVVKGWFY